jgi:thiamine biosynthesis lipoprotein
VNKLRTAAFRALGTSCVVAVLDPKRATLDVARSTIMAELEALDHACSRFRNDSDLVRLNARAGDVMQVGAVLLDALRVALRAAEVTSGLVDPTIGKTLRLSGYDAPFDIVSKRDGRFVRSAFVKGPDWTSVLLDHARRTVQVPPSVELDLGATAKALAADRGARAAAKSTGAGVLVSLGGDIAVAGEVPTEGWSIRLADDNTAPLDGPGPTVALFDGAIASSGTTVRRWTTANADSHHIIDPRTGRPAHSRWKTVTVAAATCVDANTASTAAIVLGDEAPAWLETRRLPARLVAHDGTPTFVAGWPNE